MHYRLVGYAAIEQYIGLLIVETFTVHLAALAFSYICRTYKN